MSSLGSPNPLLFGAAKDYEIEKSLRFNSGDSAKLSRTPSSAGSATTWTFSFWCKRSRLGNHEEILSPYRAGNNQESQIRFTDTTDQFQMYDGGGASGYPNIKTTRVFRDTNAWYHIVLAVDTTQGTAADRINIYVNGVKETSFELEVYGDQNKDLGYMGAQANYIGAYGYDSGGSVFYNGYLAEMHWVDGTQLTHSSFGETNEDTGEWVPKKYTGSHGSQGWYLNFSDNSNTTAGTLGADSSANSNNWTPTNFSVAAGVGCDSVTDTPTNNYATLNPLENGYGTTTYSNGNLDVAASNAWVPMRGSMSVTSGKYYWEVYGADGNTFIGVAKDNTDIHTINPMLRDGVILYYGSDGKKRIDGTFTTYGSAYGSSNVIGVALDIDNGKLYFAEDNTWQNSGDPTSGSTGTGAINLADSTGLVGSQIIPFFCKNGTQFQVNFGQRAFTHTPPTGYETLCTANLPEPTIKDGRKHFNTALYTANGGTQNITTLDFQPDLVWNKDRDASTNHNLTDSVRGTHKKLMANITNAEGDQSGDDKGTTAFLSNGFTVKDDASGNYQQNGPTGNKFTSWNWKGGGAASSNGTGSITSSVSANPSAGFSIVSWTGSGANATIGHGLGATPDFIYVKNRNDTASHLIRHSSLAVNGTMILEGTSNATGLSATDYWNTASETRNSTVFSVSSNNESNGSSDAMIAYCFAEVEGYSKVGSYTGNGNADGSMVFTGFKPAFVLIKSSSHSEAWNIFDSVRDPDNKVHHLLVPNTSTEENSTTAARELDFLSNGFKMRGTNDTINGSGKTYIYMAFAERPFKYANAR